MKKMHARILGVTLIEVLLVTAIISAVLYMSMGYMQQKIRQARYDREVAQIQQILNAGLAYYLANGKWPASMNCLQGKGACFAAVYLPPLMQNLFTYPPSPYFVSSTATQFMVIAPILSGANFYADAITMAGMLPSGYATAPSGPTNPCLTTSGSCVLYATVPPPGQDTNNATAVNFAAVYHNGACVPVPPCPPTGGTKMVASIVVAPAGVTGANTAPSGPAGSCNANDQSGCTIDAYPLSSFSAAATPKADISTGSGPYSCKTAFTGAPVAAPCYDDASGTLITGQPGSEYWRVCLSVVTEKGAVVQNDPSPSTNSAWGQLTGNVMAITRCIIPGEENGSGFTVWSQ